MKITMKKIADDLNISKMTVSRYFNGGYLSKENKERIEKYVEKYNYTPNMFARNLKSESNIIGFITPRMESKTSNKLISGIMDETIKNGYRVLIHATRFNSEFESEAVKEFMGLNAKGIVIVATPETLKKKEFLTNDKIVMIGTESKTKANIYYPEYEAAIEILKNNTKSKVFYIHTSEMLSHRLIMIKKAAEDLKLNEIECIKIEDLTPKRIKDALYICSTDSVAYEMYRLLDHQREQIGNQIEIIGFGDYDSNDLISPALSSVCYPYEETGREAIQMIVNGDLINHKTSYKIIYRSSYQNNVIE